MKAFIFSKNLFLSALFSFFLIGTYAAPCATCCTRLEVTETPTDISYDECDGTLEFTVRTVASVAADVVEVDYYIVEYSYNGTSSWTNLVEFNNNDISGGSVFYNGDVQRTMYFKLNPAEQLLPQQTCPQGIAGGCTQWGGFKIFWYVPNVVLENGGLEFRIRRKNNGVGAVDDCSDYDNISGELVDLSGEISSFNAPSSLTVSNGTKCDSISLSWNNPTDVPSCTPVLAQSTQIQRKLSTSSTWSTIATVGSGVDEYFDLVTNQSSYDYRVRTLYDIGTFGRSYYGSYSSSVSGKTKDLPGQANISSVSNNKCDGSIDVSWNFLTGASSYVGRYDSPSGFVNFTVNSGTSFTITGLTRGVDYPIQIRGVNNCGQGAWSTAQIGSSVPNPTAPTNVAVGTTSNGELELTWTDSDNENEYKIFKTVDGVSGTPISLAADVTSYIDADVEACKQYSYEVRAVNACLPNGVSGNIASGQLGLSLGNTFTTNALQASKGYYSNRVELTWSVANNANLLEGYFIYRNLLGDNGAPNLLNSITNGNIGIYLDYLADAGIQYQYKIVAYGECNGVNLYSDTVTSIGFRSPTGIVNGEVNYTGGTPVPGVRITAQNVGSPNGKSLAFNGTQTAQNTSPRFDNEFFDEMTVESWVRLNGAPTGIWSTISDCDGVSAFRLGGNANDLQFTIENGGTTESISVSLAGYTNNYIHIAGVYSASGASKYIKLFVNGVQEDSIPVSIDSIQVTAVCLGENLVGNIDEARIWNRAKDSLEIFQFHNIRASGDEGNLIAYWDLDENQGAFAYDKSRSGNLFNKNHIALSSANLWSANIPTNNQLGAAAYTNSAGDYNIVVPYSGVGQNFTITPFFPDHTFNPGNQVLFLGDNSTVQNNVNFIDNSSFQVTGTVFYRGTSCPVEDAFLKVDGTIVTDFNNNPIKTNSFGNFDIQVPIGLHTVSVEKTGHVFSAGIFPPTGQFDFQSPVSGIEFEDSTTVKVIGRVVGGLREGNKFPGLGKSKNNIGTAQIIFRTQNNCIADTIFTDPITGEYEAFILPTRHILDVSIPSNAAINFGTLSLLDLSLTPPSQTLIDTIGYDSLFTTYILDSVSFQRQLNFIYRNDPTVEVYGNDKLGINLERFMGDRVLEVVDYSNTVDTTLKINLDNGLSPFAYDVFTESHEGQENFRYTAYILAYESYLNFDGGIIVEDTVPVSDGTIIINNQLAKDPITGIELSKINTNPDKLTYLVYQFEPGKPNFTTNSSIPQFSFTQTMEISLETSNGQVFPWLPLTHPVTLAPDVYRAYLLGGQNFGQNFFTQGPETVDYVLRDPPGGGSSATRVVGSVYEDSERWGWNLGFELNNTDKVNLGAKLNIGFGVSTETDIESNTSIGSTASLSGGRSGELQRAIENTAEWSTNDNPENIGSGSDVYVGHSMNVEFGVTDYLRLVPDSMCNYVNCPLNFGNGYAMAQTASLSIVPGGYNTGFIYTQDFIESNVIPDLIDLRDLLLVNNPKYTSVLPIGDPNYGRNNDDPVFGTNASSLDSTRLIIPEDYTGLSYIYVPVTATDSLNDTIRFLNQQIKLWEDAIRQNEYEKVNIDNPSVLANLKTQEILKLEEKYAASNTAYAALEAAVGTAGIATAVATAAASFAPAPGFAFAQSIGFAATTGTGIAATELVRRRVEYLDQLQQINNKFAALTATNHTISGGPTFTFTKSSSRTVSQESTLEFGASAQFGLEVETKISNTGLGTSAGLSVEFERSRSTEIDTTVSNTVSYTLNDPDNGDNFSVDVYPSMYGWGPIFKRRAGGKTQCPHEQEEVTSYYQPGTVIAESTLQRDLPGISVDQSIITNVPIDQAAVFNLTVSNLTQTGDDQPYVVTSLSQQNPFGAIVNINGFPTQTPLIAAGTSINLTLTVEKGPGAVYDYDSLLLVVHSVCQYDFGVSDTYEDIVDSVWISARFIPTCTDVELLNPSDNWVLNNSFQDTLPVLASGYNINFFDLERLRLDYKPSSASSWIGLESFWKDTTGQPTYVPISTLTTFTEYDWLTDQIPDGNYDLRLTSLCTLAEKNSQIYSGVMDRINPHPFGTPVPGDGILGANEDISIQFNEPVDLGFINQSNFDIRGVLNETTLAHSTSLFFDGIDDYVAIDGGANIQNRDFTIDFWVKRAGLGQEVVLSQGNSILENMSIGFNASDELFFRVGNQTVTAITGITNTNWHHVAAAYNFDNETVELYLDGVLVNNGNLAFFEDLEAYDALIFGKNAATNTDFFHGNLHEVRVWNKYKTLADLVPTMNISLSPGTIGLLYNWKMDEATGIFVNDQIRQRDGVINGASWQVSPSGNSLSFDGVDDVLEITNAGNVAISNEMSFTLEFWFNSTAPGVASLFSNGSGSNFYSDSLISWNIEKDALGQIHVRHNGMDFIAVSDDFFDGEWHHFALVLQRTGNLSAYIDGNLQNAMQATNIQQFGGNAMVLGARRFNDNFSIIEDQYFDGLLDEFRFWNTNRTVEQVVRDKQNRLIGDELGLVSYLPFESYQLVLGVPVLTPTTDDIADLTHLVNTLNGAAISSVVPTIKLQRPVQAVNFTFSVNNDRIIITPTTPQELIENTTIDITVSGIKDLNGNVMQSPKTWIAYMDKNQIIWQDDVLSFEKSFGDALTFSSAIINNGGSAKVYDLTNLPDWLTASQTTGSIAPNSVVTVNFTIDPGVNIGDYTEDIHLLTDFGYPEKLSIELKVREDAPDWTVNPADYTYSMSVIGLLEIEGVVSTDVEDVLGVFIDGEARGAVTLQYFPSVDRYLAFLDVYSNAINGQVMTFKIWDASKGATYVDVIPNLNFSANGLIGTLLNPQLFEAGNTITQEIPIVQGWNWLSFNLASTDTSDLDSLLISYTPDNNDEIKGQSSFANLNNASWNGPLASTGIQLKDGFRLKALESDQLVLEGAIVDPTTRNINLVSGWNWIGFISIRNQSVAQALANLNPTDGDLIKGKSQFAVFDTNLGWVGSLQTMIPGQSYMYQATNPTSFTFPFAGAFKNGSAQVAEIQDERWPVNHHNYAGNMTHIANLDFCNLTWNELGDLDEFYLAVFDQFNECRALSMLEVVDDKLLSFLTIAGNHGDKLHYKLLHKTTGVSFATENNFNYESNALKGSLISPYVVSLTGEDCAKLEGQVSMDLFKVYPTLFNEEINVQFSSKLAENATVRLYNSIGQLVFEQIADLEVGNNLLQLNLKKAALYRGTYFLELDTESQGVRRTKVVQF